MAIATEQTGIGLSRHFTTPGADPYDTVTWERRDARITNWATGAVAFEQLGVEVPSEVERQRHQHPCSEVLQGKPGHARAGVVAPPGRRPGRRHHHGLGPQGRLLRRLRRGRGTFSAELKHLIIQQRRRSTRPSGSTSASQVYLSRPRHASSSASRTRWIDPQLVCRGRDDFQRWSGAGVNLSRIRSSRRSC